MATILSFHPQRIHTRIHHINLYSYLFLHQTARSLTCQLGHGAASQGLCRQGDDVLGGDGDDVDLAVVQLRRRVGSAGEALVAVAPSNHQALHPGLPLVDGLDV